MTALIAFSKAFLVMISLGLMFFLMRLRSALPASYASCSFFLSTAGRDAPPGRLIPMDSIAEDIVLAVYIPPHAPGPGHAAHSTAYRSFSEIFPAANSPTA